MLLYGNVFHREIHFFSGSICLSSDKKSFHVCNQKPKILFIIDRSNFTREKNDMEDAEIVDLYWQRSDDAILETDIKYGPYCRTIAYNILHNREDTEECVDDTYMGAWNSMPDKRPQRLSPFLAKITRNFALNRITERNSQRRGGIYMGEQSG